MDYRTSNETINASLEGLRGRRMVVCGHRCAGKGRVTTLLVDAARRRGEKVLVLDGDGSKRGGLARTLFGMKEGPIPVIAYVGEEARITCPTHDPSHCPSYLSGIPLTKRRVYVQDLPPVFVLRERDLSLLEVAHFRAATESRMPSAIERPFITDPTGLTLLDIGSGIEALAAGVTTRTDLVLVVADTTTESIAHAQHLLARCAQTNMDAWFILNKVSNDRMAEDAFRRLGTNAEYLVGIMHHDPLLSEEGWNLLQPVPSRASDDAEHILTGLVERLRPLDMEASLR